MIELFGPTHFPEDTAIARTTNHRRDIHLGFRARLSAFIAGNYVPLLLASAISGGSKRNHKSTDSKARRTTVKSCNCSVNQELGGIFFLSLPHYANVSLLAKKKTQIEMRNWTGFHFRTNARSVGQRFVLFCGRYSRKPRNFLSKKSDQCAKWLNFRLCQTTACIIERYTLMCQAKPSNYCKKTSIKIYIRIHDQTRKWGSLRCWEMPGNSQQYE